MVYQTFNESQCIRHLNSTQYIYSMHVYSNSVHRCTPIQIKPCTTHCIVAHMAFVKDSTSIYIATSRSVEETPAYTSPFVPVSHLKYTETEVCQFHADTRFSIQRTAFIPHLCMYTQLSCLLCSESDTRKLCFMCLQFCIYVCHKCDMYIKILSFMDLYVCQLNFNSNTAPLFASLQFAPIFLFLSRYFLPHSSIFPFSLFPTFRPLLPLSPVTCLLSQMQSQ